MGHVFPEAVGKSLEDPTAVSCVLLCPVYLIAKSWLVKLAKQLE